MKKMGIGGILRVHTIHTGCNVKGYIHSATHASGCTSSIV